MTTQWQFNQRSTADDVVVGHNLSGQLAIVTGANTGLGYETARALASVGAKVILAGRNPATNQAALERIKAAHPQAEVEFQALDLSDLNSVRSFCHNFAYPSIDLLICNAGSMSTELLFTKQNFERTVGVCHIGHFLLCKLLMPKVLAANAARIVMLSSEAHRYPKTLDVESLLKPSGKYAGMTAYGQAKLCNALMALELQNRYGDQGVTVSAVHPGNMVSTDFGSESALTRFAFKLFSPFTKNANQGAATTIVCALHEPASDIAGGYFSHCKPAAATEEAKNKTIASKLWSLSEEWVADFV